MKQWSRLPSGNDIGDAGAKVLSEALKVNATLVLLDLFCYSIWRGKMVIMGKQWW